MLDVHPPHQAAHSWRDFLLHLVTITIGLFIALSLEAGVEALHHREIVKQARENIRRELELNETFARQDEVFVKADYARMQANLELERAMRADRKAISHHSMQFTFDWNGFSDSAWRSARDSGALTYMPTDEVQQYSDNYVQSELVNQQAVAIFTRQGDMLGPLLMEKDPSQMEEADLHQLMLNTSATSVRLTELEQMIEELDGQYKKTLQK
jgi:hypothetical protein